MSHRIAFAIVVFAACLKASLPAAEPLAEKYLLDGKLADGEKALKQQLEKEPRDDQARFGLGVVQFLASFEHLGANLYKHGLRTERAFGRAREEARNFVPQPGQPHREP